MRKSGMIRLGNMLGNIWVTLGNKNTTTTTTTITTDTVIKPPRILSIKKYIHIFMKGNKCSFCYPTIFSNIGVI